MLAIGMRLQVTIIINGKSISFTNTILKHLKFSNHNEVGGVRRETRPIYILLIIRQY